MSNYKIQPYSFIQAKNLKVIIKPSKHKNKKVDVYNSNGELLASVGHPAYSDYPTYVKDKGREYANERRRLYHLRTKKAAEKVGSAAYFALNILW